MLLNRSTHLLTREGKVEMTPERREELARVNMELSMEGLRVLAFAYKELDAVRPLTLEDENGFTFIGLISMIDPPRPEAVQAVADAKRGGIRTIMITGDHKVTASAIARQLVVNHSSAVDTLLGVAAVALIFVIKKFLHTDGDDAPAGDGRP